MMESMREGSLLVTSLVMYDQDKKRFTIENGANSDGYFYDDMAAEEMGKVRGKGSTDLNIINEEGRIVRKW